MASPTTTQLPVRNNSSQINTHPTYGQFSASNGQQSFNSSYSNFNGTPNNNFTGNGYPAAAQLARMTQMAAQSQYTPYAPRGSQGTPSSYSALQILMGNNGTDMHSFNLGAAAPYGFATGLSFDYDPFGYNRNAEDSKGDNNDNA